MAFVPADYQHKPNRVLRALIHIENCAQQMREVVLALKLSQLENRTQVKPSNKSLNYSGQKDVKSDKENESDIQGPEDPKDTDFAPLKAKLLYFSK
jgi:hypothetical protein